MRLCTLPRLLISKQRTLKVCLCLSSHVAVLKASIEFIKPAVHGTIGILESALKYGKNSVKRIVTTSSTAAIVKSVSEPTILSEEDWNDISVKEVEEKGRDAPGQAKYRASKTLAEKGAFGVNLCNGV